MITSDFQYQHVFYMTNSGDPLCTKRISVILSAINSKSGLYADYRSIGKGNWVLKSIKYV